MPVRSVSLTKKEDRQVRSEMRELGGLGFTAYFRELRMRNSPRAWQQLRAYYQEREAELCVTIEELSEELRKLRRQGGI